MKLVILMLFVFYGSVCRAEIRVQELFSPKTSLLEVRKELEQLNTKNLKIVLWYFGQNGLRQDSVELYRNELFRPTSSLNLQFYLYDLTAWGQFGLVPPKPLKKSAIAEKLFYEKLKHYQILFSSDFFDWLGNLNSDASTYILDQVVPRKWLWRKSSEKFNTIGPKLPTLLETGIFKFVGSDERWNHILSNKSDLSYSFLQYLEGIYLVQELINRSKESDSLQVLFLLPNDELEYYLGSDSQYSDFCTDLYQLISKETQSKFKEINVYFQEFGFGKSRQDRPYLKGKVLKSNKISIQELL